MMKPVGKSVLWSGILVLPLACGIEKGGKISNVKETVVEPTAAPGGENTITELAGIIAGEEFTAGEIWIPTGTSVIHFSSGTTSGCDDETVAAAFTISGIPGLVGEVSAEDVAALILDPANVETDITNFTGSLSLNRVTSTDVEGVFDIKAPDQDPAYELKGSFSAKKCGGITTDGGDDEGSTDETDGGEESNSLFGNWVTACDATTRIRYWITLSDDNKFTFRTHLYDDDNCETLGVRLSRRGDIGLNTESDPTAKGDPINFSYDTAEMEMYSNAAITKANTHAYDEPLQAVSGLCGIENWSVIGTRDVSGNEACFPYDSGILHSVRRDLMIYEVVDGELNLGVIDDLIYEVESRDATSVRAEDFTHTFIKGTISTQ